MQYRRVVYSSSRDGSEVVTGPYHVMKVIFPFDIFFPQKIPTLLLLIRKQELAPWPQLVYSSRLGVNSEKPIVTWEMGDDGAKSLTSLNNPDTNVRCWIYPALTHRAARYGDDISMIRNGQSWAGNIQPLVLVMTQHVISICIYIILYSWRATELQVNQWYIHICRGNGTKVYHRSRVPG